MICVDTSALVAIVAGEPEELACIERLAGEDEAVISAATLTEATIVCGRRNLETELSRLLAIAELTVIAVDRAAATAAANAYRTWGKGYHEARLNYGDCFAYELAFRLRAPLLFVGKDFSKTDIVSAL